MDAKTPDSSAAPLPAFGTAIFSFSSAQGNSNINAHVSVLFLEEPKEEIGEQSNAQIHLAESSRAVKEKAEAQLEPGVVPPSSQPVPASSEAKVDWGPPPEGEYWIYEEDSDE